MMANWVVLDSVAHRTLRVDSTPSARFGNQVGMVAVVPREYARLVAHYPIFFRKNGETGQFEPGALLGFANDENLFLRDEVWASAYVPLQVQRQPFRVAEQRAAAGAVQAGGLAVTLDLESPRVGEMRGERLFLEDGQPSAYLTKIADVLSALVDGARAAFEFPARLASLGLIESLHIDVEFVDGSERKLEGLYSINPEKLHALPADDLIALRDLGYLEWAYVQIASLAHVSGMVAEKNLRLSGG